MIKKIIHRLMRLDWVYIALGWFVFLPISSLVPGKRNKMVFWGSAGGRFMGNAKYLFLHNCEYGKKEYDVCFMTSDREAFESLRKNGLPAVRYPSINAFKAMVRASFIFMDDSSWLKHWKFYFLFRAMRVQLWHGSPLKKIGLDNPREMEKRSNKVVWIKERLMGRFCRYDLILSSSPLFEKALNSAFGCDAAVSLGYPKNDIFYRDSRNEDLIGVDMGCLRRMKENAGGKLIALYSPTYRDSSAGQKVFPYLNLAELDSALEGQGIMFFIKTHPYDAVFEKGDYKNIYFAEARSDVYPLLKTVDVLVTDYSSIYFDFLHLEKPIIFFVSDFDRYQSEERPFYFDYETMTPGPKCADVQSLVKELTKVRTGANDGYEQARRNLKNQVFLHSDGNACRRIMDHIAQIRPGAPRRSKSSGIAFKPVRF